MNKLATAMISFAAILAVAFVLFSPVSDLSEADGGESGDLTWSYDDGTKVLAISFTDPEATSGEMVDYNTADDVPWKNHRDSITDAILPDGLTNIGNYAFYGCVKLAAIDLSEIASIGMFSFEGCVELTSVDISKATDIYRSAFKGCSGIADLTANIGCNLTENYSEPVFEGCTGIERITFAGTAGTEYQTSPGNYSASMGPWSITEQELTVIFDTGVVSIGKNMLYSCTRLVSLTICSTVTSIGNDAFRNCTGLRDLTIPITLNAVGSSSNPSFGGCSNIRTMVFNGPGAGKDYSDASYSSLYYKHTPWYQSRANLQSVTIEQGVTRIGDNMFNESSSFSNLTIPVNLTVNEQFSNCTAVDNIVLLGGNVPDYSSERYKKTPWYCSTAESISIEMKTGVGSIGTNMFSECTKLTSITVDDSVLTIGNYAFNGCTGLASFDMPSNVTSIGSNAFNGCTGLASIVIPSGVTSIGSYAFRGCSSLTSIDIPSTLTTKLKTGAFANCTGLETMTIPIGTTDVDAFKGCVALRDIEIIKGSLDAPDSYYNNTAYEKTPWGRSESDSLSIVFGAGITSIPKYMFRESGVKCVTLTESVTTIGAHSFERSSLTTLSNYSSVKTYGDYAFAQSGITSIVIPASVTSIGMCAFMSCSELRTVEMRTDIGLSQSAFQDCSNMEEITLSIERAISGIDVFKGCNGIRKVTVIGVDTGIGFDFYDSNATTTNSYKRLPWYYSKDNPIEVTVDPSVKKIGNNTFKGCTDLNLVAFGTGMEALEFSATNPFPYNFDGGDTGTNVSGKTFLLDTKEDVKKYYEGYTLTFDLGAHGDSFDTLVTRGTVEDPLVPVTDDGFAVVGWYEDAMLTDPWDFETDEVTSDMTLYAMMRKSISVCVVDLGEPTYNGSSQTLSFTVMDGDTTVASTNYDVSGDTSGTNVDEYSFTLTGKGEYAGSLTATWRILPQAIAGTIDAISPVQYDGSEKEPEITITGMQEEAESGITIEYSNNIDAGTATVTVSGTGNYSGTLTGNFTITQKPLSTATITVDPLTYNGQSQNVIIYVDGVRVLADSGDFTLTGGSGTDAATYEATVTAKVEGNYSGSAVEDWRIDRAKLVKPTEDPTVFIYNGAAQIYAPVGFGTGMLIANETRIHAGSQSVTVSISNKTNYEWDNEENPGDQGALTFTFAIGALPITVTVTGGSDTLVYNGQVQTVTGFTATSSSNLYEVSNAACTSASASGTNVGTYNMGLTPAMFSGNDANFSFTFVVAHDGYLAIDPKPVTVKADDKSKVYGSADPEFTVAYDGLVGSDTVSCESITRAPGFDVGRYTITPAGATSQGNYSVSFETGTLAITKKHLTITADDISVEYSTPSPAYTASGSGFAYNETIAVLGGSPAFNSAYRPHDVAGQTHSITVSGYASTNYEISYGEAGTLTVVKKGLNVPTDDVREFTYTGLEQTYVPAGFDSETMEIEGDKRTDAGACTVNVVLKHPGNYFWIGESEHDPSFSFVIDMAPLTITPADVDVPYGTVEPAYNGADGSGFVNGETMAVIGGAPVFASSEYRPTDDAGTERAISVTGYASTNYSISYSTGTLTVVKAILEKPTANTTGYVYTGVDQTYEPIGYDAERMALMDGTMRTAGTQEVTVTLRYATNYAWAGEQVNPTFTFRIHPATLTARPVDEQVFFGDEKPAFRVAYTGFVNDETDSVVTGTPVFSCSYEAGDPNGTYPVVITGGISAANYELDYDTGTLTVGKIILQAPTPLQTVFTYNGSPQTYIPVGYVEETMSITGNTRTDAGRQTFTVSIKDPSRYEWADGSTNPEYTFTIGSMTINDSMVTVDPLTYNGVEQDAVVTVNSGIPSMTSADYTVTGQTTGRLVTETGYTLTVTGTGNYGGAVIRTWFIAKAPLTITASDVTVTYGTESPAYSATGEGFVNGETMSVLGGIPEFSCDYRSGDPAGTAHDIEVDRYTSDNYEISYGEKGTLTVVKARLVQPTADTREFTFNGSAQIYEPDGFVPAKMTKAGYEQTRAGSYTVSVAIADKYNYEWTTGGQIDLTFDFLIAKKLLLPSMIAPAPLTYSGQSQTVTIVVDDGIAVAADYIVTDDSAVDAGVYSMVVRATADGNYTGEVTRAWSISKKALTVTPDSTSVVYGADAPEYRASGSGFVNGETMSVLGGAPEFSCDYNSGDPAGTAHDIEVSGYTSGNYEIGYAFGRLAVTQKSVTVIPADASKVYGDADPEFTATVEGLIGSDSVAYTIGRVAGEVVGEYVIISAGEASQGNYSVSHLAGVLTITPFEGGEVEFVYESEDGKASIGADSMEALVADATESDGVTLTISGEDATITFDSSAIKALGTEAMTLTLTRHTRGDMGEMWSLIEDDRAVYSISLGEYRSFSEGRVKIVLPYQLMEGEDPSNLQVLYIADGEVKERISCTYENGFVTFYTSHLSTYGVKYVEPGNGDSGPPVVGIVIGIVAVLVLAGGATAFFVIRKKRSA